MPKEKGQRDKQLSTKHVVIMIVHLTHKVVIIIVHLTHKVVIMIVRYDACGSNHTIFVYTYFRFFLLKDCI
jgi:hypothetical protein